MAMADANKSINLAAPLISVGRHGGSGAEAKALPSYKPGGTSSGPLGHVGVVPIGWEHHPGHPKSVRTRRPPPPPPPPTTTAAKEDASPTRKPAAAARAEEERCSTDARSRDNDVSCVTVNCSATGISDAAVAAAPGTRGSSAMTDRFLPVASPLSTFRKAGSVREPARPAPCARDRLPMQRQLSLQHVRTNHLQLISPQDRDEEHDDDSESDVHSTHGFASKRCGLLHTRCVKSTLLLLNPAPALRRCRSLGARRGEGRSFVPDGGRSGSQREASPLLRRSRNGQGQQQQQLRHTGGHEHDPGTVSWEELYVKSLLRSARSSLMGPAAAVDRTVRELYRRRRGEVVQPKASHLGLLLVLDGSNEQSYSSSARDAAGAGETAPLLPRTESSPNAGKKLRRGSPDNVFPLLLDDRAAEPGRQIVSSPQAMLPLPLPKSPSESWLSRALPTVSNRPPPVTSFLGLQVQSRKHAPLPWCSIDPPAKVVDHDRQRHIRVHDLQK